MYMEKEWFGGETLRDLFTRGACGYANARSAAAGGHDCGRTQYLQTYILTAFSIYSRGERVQHYLYLYLYSEWAGPNPEVGRVVLKWAWL